MAETIEVKSDADIIADAKRAQQLTETALQGATGRKEAGMNAAAQVVALEVAQPTVKLHESTIERMISGLKSAIGIV